MPLNLLKKYNELLDIISLPEEKKKASLYAVFIRDISFNSNFKYKNKQITPTPADGEIKMETLFTHLTTQVVDKTTRKREFDYHRSIRLHWVKFHIEEKKLDNILCFSVKEPEGNRTYIYDKDEKYVIVLEPLRNGNSYYLLTAYHVMGKDAERDKMIKKYKRRLSNIL